MSAFFEPRLTLRSVSSVTGFWRLWRNNQQRQAIVDRYLSEGHEISSLLDHFRELNDEAFETARQRFSNLARRGLLIRQRSQLLESLAWVTVCCEKSLNMTPYPIQLSCALAMIDGYLVQLAPGEGKTLTIALASLIFGWSRKPCHVVTANDYLAKRDRDLMLPLYDLAGVSAGYIDQDQPPEEKSRNYQAHVVYGTAKQFLADYLNDVIILGGLASRTRIAMTHWKAGENSLQMRGLYYVIIDEADSILIDDATTPLIISTQEENGLLHQAVIAARDFVDDLTPGEDYLLPVGDWDVVLTDVGQEKVIDSIPSFPTLWHHHGRLEDLIIQAILARDRFKLDEHFVIVDGEVVLVDESTGRMMHGRSWSYGLHQAVEARVGVELTPPSKTLEKMSFQAFFQSYHHLTGASGTLQNIQSELFHTYQVKTLEMPSRLKSQLEVTPYRCFASKEDKDNALVQLLREIHATGLPILLGTRRIRDTERLEALLTEEGFAFSILNAKRLEQEAQIVAHAGEPGRLTLATNMAGRGTDISVPNDVISKGGLQVIMYEPHDSSRIDWQLFGRSGRQGKKGRAIPLVSLDDVLFLKLRWWQKPLLKLAGFLMGSSPGNQLVKLLVNIAQKNAQNAAFKQRKVLAKTIRLSQERMSFIRSKTQLKL